MPVIFIHGVNTRAGRAYEKSVSARDALLRIFVLEPLARRAAPFQSMEIVSPYWGKHGVTFAWKQASLPVVDTMQHLGPVAKENPESNLEIAAVTNAPSTSSAVSLQRLGVGGGGFKQAATRDLPRLTEAILSPFIFSELTLPGQPGETAEIAGQREALLMIAGWRTAKDPNVVTRVALARNDTEVVQLIREETEIRFYALLAEHGLVPGGNIDDEAQGLQTLGRLRLSPLQRRIKEVFDRALGAPARVGTLPLLELFRRQQHDQMSRFLGDIFVYLTERGDRECPGAIVSTVLTAIKKAPRHHPEEPVIVITHSMGGNILYDILTYYDPSLQVDAWVSVGGQVGQFEEMKLFKMSDRAIHGPAKVSGLKPRLTTWLNVYDPVDVFAFRVAPIFADVDADEQYLTGAGAFKSHGAYFMRPSFYSLVYRHLERTMT